jgi:UDP-N-acetylglucosamine--N-acetylmuramyl-(pentapeptide) pyrophosphoryl-undecaprenol N-acetylglucosamine transferase
MSSTLCFVAGRSGGHIVPALTLAREYKLANHAKTIFIATDIALDKHIVSADATIDQAYYLHLDNFPGKSLIKYPRFLYDVISSCLQSFRILRKHKVEKIICTGGHIALPVCLAATILRIPIQLWELNATPGKAIKLLAPLATSIKCTFPDATRFFPAQKVSTAPYPIRFTPSWVAPQLPEGFSSSRKTILIIGGSQGSRFINNLIRQWLASNTVHTQLQIIHQTGINHIADWQEQYQRLAIPAIVFGYSTQIERYYQIADLIICRSGAGSLFETLFFKKPFITIPLETAVTDHQLHNARAIALGYPQLCTMLTEKELSMHPTLFADSIKNSVV